MLIVKRPFRDGSGKLIKTGDPFPNADQLDPEYRSALIAQGEAEEIEGEDPASIAKFHENDRLVRTEKLHDAIKKDKDVSADGKGREFTKAEKAKGLDKRVVI